MLLAHLPNGFKTPGSYALISSDSNGMGIICDAAERAELVALRREALEEMKPKITASNEAVS